MKITIQKSVPEEIEIEVPGYFKNKSMSYTDYMKVAPDETQTRFTLYDSGGFSSASWKSERELHTMITKGDRITEAEFITAFHELQKRMYLAAEVPEKDLIEIHHEEMKEWDFAETLNA